MIMAASLLNEKYDRICHKKSVLFNFPCISLCFDGLKHNFSFAILTLAVANVSTDMTISCAF